MLASVYAVTVLRHACLCLLLACSAADAPVPAAPTAPAGREGAELVGRTAHEFTDLEWLDGRPRTLAGLRGQTVLVRFWTDTCPYCRGTAPKLQRLDRELGGRGLVVLGVYHPKPRGRPVTPAEVRATVDAWGFEFPIAIDASWSTLDAWWLTTGDRSATSASLVIDCRGVIRMVHPGPEYSDAEYDELHATISTALAEC